MISCSNSPEGLENTEIQTIKSLHQAIKKSTSKGIIIDVRKIMTRERISKAKVPVLFVKLKNGQNGTLTKYPGLGVGTTWLGADGATITLDRGVIIASRGMGADVMGGENMMPRFSQISGVANYQRRLSYLEEDNKIKVHNFECQIKKQKSKSKIKVLELEYTVSTFLETCQKELLTIKNKYLLDTNNIVRRSYQYHSDTIGYILTERLD